MEVSILANTTTNLQLLLSQGPLSSLWANKALTNSVAINNGQIYIGLNNSDKRAMLFIDKDGSRYVLTADVHWNDLRGVPTNFAYQADISNLQTSITNGLATKVSKSGDTMTGALTIARSSSSTSPRVSLDYNDTTDSLDFIFT